MDIDKTIVPVESGVEGTSEVSTPDQIFDAFGDEGDGEVVPELETPASPEGAPAHTAPDGAIGAPPAVVPPGPAAVAPPPPVVPGAVVPTAPVAAASAPVATPPVAAPVEQPATPVADRAVMRENLVAEIAERYAMPETVRDEFMMNPEKVLPIFAARLYVDIYDALVNTVLSQVPQIIGAREQQVTTQRNVEDKFFTRWPTLKDPSLQGDIASVARAYRQQNPKATFEQSIEAVGAMVSVMKGVPLPGPASAPQSIPQNRPPLPAGVGASRAPAPAAPQANLFEEIFSRED